MKALKAVEHEGHEVTLRNSGSFKSGGFDPKERGFLEGESLAQVYRKCYDVPDEEVFEKMEKA